jgi:hypothetical protein
VSLGSEMGQMQWREYNRLLLCKIFTMTEFAYEYGQFLVLVCGRA